LLQLPIILLLCHQWFDIFNKSLRKTKGFKSSRS
jgi:hypothetical protein